MVNSITILDHISITVSDMDKSLEFYCDLLGLREVESHHLEGKTIDKMADKLGVVMEVVRLEGTRHAGNYDRPAAIRQP